MKLTGEETGSDKTLKEAEEEADGEDGWHAQRETEAEEEAGPHDHSGSQELGDREAADALVGLESAWWATGTHDGLADNDATPQERRGQRIVLALGADVLLPAHDSGIS